jgi:hypothetical protein
MIFRPLFCPNIFIIVLNVTGVQRGFYFLFVAYLTTLFQ